jgi:hypothetical protein
MILPTDEDDGPRVLVHHLLLTLQHGSFNLQSYEPGEARIGKAEYDQANDEFSCCLIH